MQDPNKIDFDKFGHCCLCHKNMLINQVVNGEIVERLTADYTEAEYMLDDGSRMRVAMCKDCKSKLTDDDQEQVMKCVVRGWEEEVKGFKHWTEDKKKNYLDVFSKKTIVCNSEGLPDKHLEEKIKKYHANKIKEVKIGLHT